jgi:hypothetical protein
MTTVGQPRTGRGRGTGTSTGPGTATGTGTGTMGPAVLCEELVYRFGEHVAVNDVDLEIRHGETFRLLGPNGAGKPVTGLRLLFWRRCRWSVICNPAMRSRSRWLVFLITVSWPASR